jgi:HPt (histidine-containing phosphotransfer) domain-containing protein
MNQTILDKMVLQKLYGNSSADILDILTEFIFHHDHIRTSLASCYQTANREHLKSLLHYHAPAFTYTGFPSLTDRCHRLEQLCDKNVTNDLIKTRLTELLQQLDLSKQLAVQEIANLTLKPYRDNWGIV